MGCEPRGLGNCRGHRRCVEYHCCSVQKIVMVERGSRLVLTGNLILAVVTIVWGLLVIHSKRRWLPVMLLVLGIGWLVNVIEILAIHH